MHFVFPPSTGSYGFFGLPIEKIFWEMFENRLKDYDGTSHSILEPFTLYIVCFTTWRCVKIPVRPSIGSRIYIYAIDLRLLLAITRNLLRLPFLPLCCRVIRGPRQSFRPKKVCRGAHSQSHVYTSTKPIVFLEGGGDIRNGIFQS